MRCSTPPAGSTLLDFGTGTGTYALAFALERPDLRVIALDEQPEMLERVRAKLGAASVTNVEPLEPSGLGALHSCVERIVAINVLHEVGDAALATLRDLLAPDGLALIADWNAAVDRPVGPPADHVYDLAGARERLLKAGFVERRAAMFPYHYALVLSVV